MTQVHKHKARSEGAPVEEIPTRPEDTATKDLLDEIDGVLESEADEFVNSFEQKGGE